MSRTSSSCRQQGLTLIEVMVVVTLTSLLVLVAVQFGAHWINNAKVRRSQAALQHAFSSAKAIALQNHLAATGDQVAATLCAQASRLDVVVGAACDATPAWSVALEAPVVVQLGPGGAGTCIALSNAGVPLAPGGCVTDLSYSITAGAVHVENQTLY